ncbi:hypothetical protein S245_065646, partial [Arachis hypogaea]
ELNAHSPSSLRRSEEYHSKMHSFATTHAMFLQLAFEIILTFLCFVHTSESAQITISPKCDSMCGEFEILYLFGMNDPACYAGKWFEIECLNTSMNNVPTLTPYLKAADLEVRSIDALRSTVTVGRRRGLTMEER